jgi:cytochrome P450
MNHVVPPLVHQAASEKASYLPVAPGPHGLPLLGTLLPYFRQGLFQLALDTRRRYGTPFRLKLGPQHLTFLDRPEDVQQVLAGNKGNYPKAATYADYRLGLGQGIITLDPPEWLPRKLLLQPYFTERAVKAYAPLIVEEAARLIARWQAAASQHQVVDMAEELMRLALRIIMRVVGSDGGPAVEQIERDFRVILLYISNLSTGVGILRRLFPTPGRTRFQRARMRLRAAMLHQVYIRRVQKPRVPDVLTHLLEARNDAFPAGLSDEQVVDEVLTLLVAGSETISLLLARIVLALATHPAVAHQLQAEVDQVLAGRLPTLDDVPRLVYTAQVRDEGLRRDPSVWIFPRQAQQPDVVGSYQPFGLGVHTCLGGPYSEVQGPLILATIFRLVRLRLAPDQAAVPQDTLESILQRFPFRVVVGPRRFASASGGPCPPRRSCLSSVPSGEVLPVRGEGSGHDSQVVV